MAMNPLSAWPPTRERRDAEGLPKYAIRFAVLTPLRARIAHAVSKWVAGAIGLVTGAAFALYPLGGVMDVARAIAVALATLFVTVFLVFFALYRSGDIDMSIRTISVRRWYGWQHLDRNMEHSFALAVHDRARDEQRANDLATREAAAKGRVIQPGVYYGESYHVVLVYGGHRIDLASVYGLEVASALVARLKYCDRCLNDAARMSGGISKRPEDDWVQSPGGLSDA